MTASMERRTFISRAAQALAQAAGVVDLRDVCAFSGIGLMSYGAQLMLPPAGYIVPGIALFYLATRRT